MAVDERARRHLYERLDEILGGEAADTLMEELAFIGREQLARRHDIELLRRDMDAGFAQARTERQAVRAELRGEFEALRGSSRRFGGRRPRPPQSCGRTSRPASTNRRARSCSR